MSYQYILDFLNDLKQNNNREWFGDNKERYNKSLLFFKQEVKKLIENISSFDVEISNLNSHNCIFRIYRDIRFSQDKTPYKTHFGAYIAKNGGRKSEYAGYYLHIDANTSFIAGGVYAPNKDLLRKIREEIDVDYEELLRITHSKKFEKYFGKIQPLSEPLKRVPIGFSADSPAAELLKYKHFVIECHLNNNILTAPNFIDYATEVYCAMKPLNYFFNNIIDSWFNQ